MFSGYLISSGYSELDKEAIRIISNSPKWTPAIYEGKIVSQFFTIPINFD